MDQIVKIESESPVTSTVGTSSLAKELLSAIPLALAAPVLEYQKTRSQAKLLEISIQARYQERTEILRTIQILAKYGQLTEELSCGLLIAYNTHLAKYGI